MILAITKEEGDKILETFLVGASKENGSVECAKESIEILGKFDDSHLIISFLISNSLRKTGQVDKDVFDFEINILSAISTIYNTCDKSDIPIQFGSLFYGTEDEVLERVKNNKKLHFAVQAFTNAFYTFDKFEKKYPEITKML